MWEILHGDCVPMMGDMAPESVDSIVTDPPYDLTSMTKRFGAPDAKPPGPSSDGRFTRLAKGFMGQTWDGTGVAFSPLTWAAAYRVLKPCGHVLAFGGTRTHHRMMCAIEDAGFEIRDTMVYWSYGTGFPKSLNLDGGLGTALKPAFEPIVMARKPLAGSVKANVDRYGTGALNIDECRIGFADEADERESKDKNRHADFGSGARVNQVYGADTRRRADGGNYDASGRWPANVLLDEEAAAELDRQSGESKSNGGMWHGQGQANQIYGVLKDVPSAGDGGYGDVGGASRFFFVAKPDRAERDTGLYGLRHHAGGELTGRADGSAGTRSPRAGSGRTNGGRNTHPTVKPVKLLQHLVSLVTPKGGLVLDPFLGSGTTIMAALRCGRRAIGIEQSAEYVEIAKRRIVGDAPLFNAEVSS
jgi:site-specific DNA-methyltransferase (adenine-specific)